MYTEPCDSDNNTGGIIGAVAGGVFTIIIVEVIIVIAIYCYHNKDKDKKS